MFDMKKPCSNCPFLKVGGIRLRPARAREITADGVFPCHKTVTHNEESDDDDMIVTGEEQYCAGKLILNIKRGNYDQMMRIGTRTGWNPDTMTNLDTVFDTVQQMVTANRKAERSRG